MLEMEAPTYIELTVHHIHVFLKIIKNSHIIQQGDNHFLPDEGTNTKLHMEKLIPAYKQSRSHLFGKVHTHLS